MPTQPPTPSVRVPLLGGSYLSRSLISSAQIVRNLYPESAPAENQTPTPVVHLLTPGLVTIVQPDNATVRCLYRDTRDALYGVIGTGVYRFDSVFGYTLIGTIGAGVTPVSICDNGITAVLVDGSANGYWWDLATDTFATISDPSFYGANRVCFLDGFFVFNRPLTNQFYLSPPYWDGATLFDPTYIATKTGGADRIVSIGVIRGELWLLGALTSEVWYNAGEADFPFARQPGVLVNHGMLGGWSVSENDVELFWLGRDIQGRCIVFMGKEYQAVRVSNYAMEDEIQTYSQVNDTIGFTYQQEGHTFYVLTFTGANRTWVYDVATSQWHTRAWRNPATGVQNRHRANCFAFANNVTVVGDFENGTIYKWDLQTYTDFGGAITRTRAFPHMVDGGKRISHNRFIADFEVGSGPASTSEVLTLDWSDDRGANYGNPIALSLSGASPAGLRSLLVTRLGLARDRVYRLQWDFPYDTSLQGAWLETEQAET